VLSQSCCEYVYIFLDEDISHCVIDWISPKIFLKYAGLLSTTMQSLMDSKTVSKRDSMDQGLLVCVRCCSFYGFADARAVEFRNHPLSYGGPFKHEYALFKSMSFRLFHFEANPF
jgi:hypothetical protein